MPVWDPHCFSHVNTLERVLKFILGMIHRAWEENYIILFQRSGLQSLSDGRKCLKLCYLFVYDNIYTFSYVFFCLCSCFYTDYNNNYNYYSNYDTFSVYIIII